MMIPKVEAEDWYEIRGRGHVAAVVNYRDGETPQVPHDFPFKDFLKTGAVIDGKYYRVFGVETAGLSRRNFGLLIGAER